MFIEHKIDYLIHKNDFGRLLGWIDCLPPEYKEESFKIAVIYALYYAETRVYDISHKWVDKMKARKENYKYN